MSTEWFAYGDATAIDLRAEMAALIHGRVDMTPQGKQVVLRRMSNQTCNVCWDPKSGGSTRPHCPYCDGCGYLWSETIETCFMAHGVAPIYKPGILGTGQYPQSSYGYIDPQKLTIYFEYFVYPNYEAYTYQTNKSYDIMFELKVDYNGNTIHPHVRAGKWKVLTVTPMFGDYGRVEFFEVGCEKSNTD
jgi:hypothetical protein